MPCRLTLSGEQQVRLGTRDAPRSGRLDPPRALRDKGERGHQLLVDFDRPPDRESRIGRCGPPLVTGIDLLTDQDGTVSTDDAAQFTRHGADVVQMLEHGEAEDEVEGAVAGGEPVQALDLVPFDRGQQEPPPLHHGRLTLEGGHSTELRQDRAQAPEAGADVGQAMQCDEFSGVLEAPAQVGLLEVGPHRVGWQVEPAYVVSGPDAGLHPLDDAMRGDELAQARFSPPHWLGLAAVASMYSYAPMSIVGQRARSTARWLLSPLLVVVDRRIAWRVRQLDERVSRAEQSVAGLEAYAQLLAGALPSPADMDGGRPRPLEVSEPNGSAAAVADRQRPHGGAGFLEGLACPVCRSAADVVPEIVTADGRVKRGYVPCAVCGELIAEVRDFRVDFRRRGGAVPSHAEPPRVVPVPGELRIPFDDPRLQRTGEWFVWDNRHLFSHGSVADSLEYRGKFSDALVHMVNHTNGGIVDFFIDGKLTATADLYSDHWFVLPFTIASDLPYEEHVLRIQPRGMKNAAATAADVFVAELVLHGPQTDPSFQPPQAMNRGNKYIEVFERYIGQVPADELILEVGGGERRRLRRGYINLEYMTVECADVYGDIQRLPFQDDTFSLVLTQAVFEHLNDPFTAAAELIRVTRPGGLIVTDVAFMQPLHAAPYHYFNMSPWGVEELFKSCAIVESDHYDGIAFTIDWILKSVGAQRTMTDDEFTGLMDRIRAIESRLSHEDVRPAASGVWLVARKPGDH